MKTQKKPMSFRGGFKKIHPQKVINFTHDIRHNNNLCFGERIFLAEIDSLLDDKGEFQFNPIVVGKLFDVSAQTIRNWVKNLRKNGFLEFVYDFDSPYKNKVKIKRINRY